MYCVYLTIIWHPNYGKLYYVGMADGINRVPGVNYNGSCKYPHFKQWVKRYSTKTRVIARFQEFVKCAKAESEIIQKALYKWGSFLRSMPMKDGSLRTWLQRFKSGNCLNGHWGDASQINTPESVAKMLATQISNGQFAKFREAGRIRSHESYVKAAESRDYADISKKRVATQLKSGKLQTFIRKGLEASDNPESRRKMVQSHDYINAKKRTNYSQVHRKVRVVGTDIVGSITEVCRAIGHLEYKCSVSQKFVRGGLFVEHRGVKFECIG